jgi:hypothetical protein
MFDGRGSWLEIIVSLIVSFRLEWGLFIEIFFDGGSFSFFEMPVEVDIREWFLVIELKFELIFALWTFASILG